MCHNRIRNLSFFLLAIWAASGCGPRTYLFGGGRAVTAAIPRPSAADPSQFGPIEFPAGSTEQQRNLPPGTLSQRGRLIRADAEAVCFEVMLSGTDAQYADVRNWSIQVRSSDGGASSTPQVLQQTPPVTMAMDGLVPETITVGTETICRQRDQYNTCQQWVTQPITQTQWVPGVVEVSTTTATVCFANTALVGAATSAVALRFNANDLLAYSVDSPRRITFQWNFAAPAATTPTTTATPPTPGG